MSVYGPSPTCSFKLLPAIVLGVIFASSPARAESIYDHISAEEAKSLSSPLKVYICTEKRSRPGWCDDFDRQRLLATKKRNLKPDAKALAAAKAKLAIEIAENTKAILATMERERSKIWRRFLKDLKPNKITSRDAKYLFHMAALENYPEANELLGYAYSVGSGVLKENQVKAYRQYGWAFLKGLGRVRSNLALVWKKLKEDQQLALQREFEKAAAARKKKAAAAKN